MRKDTFTTFKKVLKSAKNIVIVTHWSPDGDAMGSSLALYHYFTRINKQVKVIVPNSYPEFLDWLPGNNKVINFQDKSTAAKKAIRLADLIFTLDFNSYKRLEKLGELLAESESKKVLIDHHREPDSYATYYFHDENACSTCELIFDFIVGMGDKKLIDKKIASCIYTGMMTDTGSFRYPSVNHKTHLVLSELLKTGIVPADIHSAIYDNYSLNRLKLLGFALNEKLKISSTLPVAYFTVNEKELKSFDYQKGDLEGLVNYPFSIKGIKVCALFNETDEGYVKVSFRSKGKIDVNKFARSYFNGGGHINAAGGKFIGTLSEAENSFVKLSENLF